MRNFFTNNENYIITEIVLKLDPKLKFENNRYYYLYKFNVEINYA